MSLPESACLQPVTPRTTFTVSIEVEVTDEACLRIAAYNRALQDELTEEEAREFLDESKQSIRDCLIMLFDPGAVEGCSIHGSSAVGWL